MLTQAEINAKIAEKKMTVFLDMLAAKPREWDGSRWYNPWDAAELVRTIPAGVTVKYRRVALNTGTVIEEGEYRG